MSTYTELQADVADYLHRTDLTTQITGFIDKARLRIARDLRSLEQEVTTTLTTPSSSRFTLPTDFVELRRASSGGVPLRNVSQNEMDYWSAARSPAVCAVYNRILWAPGCTTVDITYFRIEAKLTSGSTEHPTMAAHPQIWLNASLLEAALYLWDEALASRMGGLYTDEVAAVNARAESARYGPTPAVVNSDLYMTFGEAAN